MTRKMIRGKSRSGLSLIEVMLAIAILGGSVVAIGELIRIGSLSAAHARDMTRAQLLCEAKMAEVLTGVTQLSGVAQQAFDPSTNPGAEGWTFSVETGQTEIEGVLSVMVTVQQDESFARPVVFSMSAWMIDPSVEFAEEEEEEGSNSSSGSNSGGNSSGGNSSGGTSRT